MTALEIQLAIAAIQAAVAIATSPAGQKVIGDSAKDAQGVAAFVGALITGTLDTVLKHPATNPSAQSPSQG